MTTGRFRRVEEIFHLALALDPDRRSAFLDEACGGDAALRAEVAALIARDRSGDEMFSAAPFGDATFAAAATDAGPPLSGTRVGVYEIGALIGVGGMGRVYRARDTRLGRDVAIKVLPPDRLSDPDRVARFEREARILASLNHPHIATLFGIEEDGPARALVLELVEGPTLADRIAERPGIGLPIDECTRIARQITDALDAAHQAGIVHRDLKPANIKVTPGGMVKVLDFGLARAQPATDDVWRVDAHTRDGAIVGTPAYMSPEQARGQSVDRRTDIWAFGCILYEMLAGRPAFNGVTASDTLSVVLSSAPDWRALPAATPPALERLVRRCLEKNPAARLRDIGDAWLESELPAATTASPPSQWRSRLALLVLPTALLAVAAGWVLAGRNSTAPIAEPIEFRVDLPAGHAPWSGIDVAPDGRRLAIGTFGDGSMIWVYDLGAGTWTPIQNTAQAAAPFWAPDGASLGYSFRGQLWRADAAGGPAVRLADAAGWHGASWGSRGEIVFTSAHELYTVRADGGPATKLSLPAADGVAVARSHPRFLPDGRQFIYHERGAGGGAIYVGSIDGGVGKHLVDSAEPAAFAPPDALLFVRGTALVAQRLDLDTLTLRGQPVVVAADAAPGFLSARAAFSASPGGVLAFVRSREGTRGRLGWFDRVGQPAGSIDQPEAVEYLNPAISPDGTRVAVNCMDPQTGIWDVWILDVASGVRTRLTSGGFNNSDPVWSPDGTEIAFVSDRGGGDGIYRKAVDGTGVEERLYQADRIGDVIPTDWRAGTIVFSQSRFAPAGWDVFLLRLEDGSVSPLPEPRAPVRYAGRISPDGRWLAYAAVNTGGFEVYVRPLGGEGATVQVSRGGGIHPRWTADGRTIHYWAQPGGIKAVDVDTTTGSVRAGAPRLVIAVRVAELIDGRTHYDVTRDGQRFLLRQPMVAAEPPIGVIVNWTRKLSR